MYNKSNHRITMYPVANPLHIFHSVFIIGKWTKWILSKSHVPQKWRSRHAQKRYTMTFRKYHESKLLDLLQDASYRPIRSLSVDVLQIIVEYTNGTKFQCAACPRAIMLYHPRCTGDPMIDGDIKFDRHELKREHFVLLLDNKTLICRQCLLFNHLQCRVCGIHSYDLSAFLGTGFCDHCRAVNVYRLDLNWRRFVWCFCRVYAHPGMA